MSLDLDKVFPQVGDMVVRLKSDAAQRQQRLKFALDTLHNQADNLSHLARKIGSSKTTWLVAGLVDGFDRQIKAPPAPAEFTILAADGSHIDVDRHRSPRCYLINIGSVVLRYGGSPDATLDSFPHLYSRDEELVITPNGNKIREQVVEGTLLGIKRSVDECCQLAELAAELPEDNPGLALVDGTLILWSLEAYPEFVTEALLDKGFLSHLSRIKGLNSNGREIALASYISFPRSTEVVNALRLALCPHDVLDTDLHCGDCQERKCEMVAGIRDRDLFSELLGQGERSCLFTSRSKIVDKKYPEEHRIYFFYLRVDDETARVEIPKWVATDEDLLNLTHSLILDQCQRGQGYPVALSEAHEQAVVTGADRENFWRLVESLLVDEHLPSLSSAKSRSKKTRWV
ncbi:MAG: DNA double-strand break repair nuclease NurA [Chloroflexi bacterium]|nr:DNA double-strand break repair nuclease NurA [Chloroflexota bacterium]